MTRRVGILLAAVLIAPVLAACESTTGGSPTTSAAPVSLWNPCTEIPDATLTAAGLRPETEETGIGGVHQDGWEICAWKGKNFYVSVYSAARPVADIESKAGNVEFRDASIAGRAGRQFKIEGASKDLGCDVVFPAAQGLFQLQVLNAYGSADLEDPCAVLRRVGNSIVPVLPK
ncbi:DUF3558 domain-containing protein [Nocardia sp. NPDC127579]|uniref:DUF3558 domain-containing protein n=1 Tax=Nocardia sp. NPDC127579 TaxID=3345402 RepID=UPI00362B2DFD